MDKLKNCFINLNTTIIGHLYHQVVILKCLFTIEENPLLLLMNFSPLHF